MKKLFIALALLGALRATHAQKASFEQFYAPAHSDPEETKYGNYKTYDYYVLSTILPEFITGHYTPALYRLKPDTIHGDFKIITLISRLVVADRGVSMYDTAHVDYTFNLQQAIYDKEGTEIQRLHFNNMKSTAKSYCKKCDLNKIKTEDSLIRKLVRPALAKVLEVTSLDISNQFTGKVEGNLTNFLSLYAGFKCPPEIRPLFDSIRVIKKVATTTPEKFVATTTGQISFWNKISTLTGAKNESGYRTVGWYNVALCHLLAGQQTEADQVIEKFMAANEIASIYKKQLQENAGRIKERLAEKNKPAYIHEESMKPKYTTESLLEKLFTYPVDGVFTLKDGKKIEGKGKIGIYNIHNYGPGIVSWNREDFNVDIYTGDGLKTMRLSKIATVQSDIGSFVVKKVNSLSEGITYSLLHAAFDSEPLKVFAMVFPVELPDWTSPTEDDKEKEKEKKDKERYAAIDALPGTWLKKQAEKTAKAEEPAKNKEPQKTKVMLFYQKKDEKEVQKAPLIGGGRWLEKYFADCPGLAEKIKSEALKTPKEIGDYYLKNRK